MTSKIYFAAFTVNDDDYGCATDTDEIVQYLSNVTTDEGLSNFMVWDKAESLIADHVERGPLTAAYLEGEDQPATDASPSAPQTPDASALMLAALRLAAERIEMNNYGGEEDEHLAVIRAAIAAANGEA